MNYGGGIGDEDDIDDDRGGDDGGGDDGSGGDDDDDSGGGSGDDDDDSGGGGGGLCFQWLLCPAGKQSPTFVPPGGKHANILIFSYDHRDENVHDVHHKSHHECKSDQNPRRDIDDFNL